MESVELHQAHMWDCPECGRENFCRAVTAELTPDDRRGIAADNPGLDAEAVQGEFVSAPEEVTCKHCGVEFSAERPERWE